MSVNRKGEKFNFESAPTDSYKSGLKIGEKTWSLDQIFIIVVVVAVVVIKLLKGNTFSYPLLKISRHEWQMQSGSPS